MDPAWVFWLLVASGLALLLPVCRADSRASLHWWAIALCAVAGLALLWAGAWSWVLRDGLGPGMKASEGRQAWARFWQEFHVALWPIGLQLTAGAACYRWRMKRLVASGAS
jgi:hypothetical protein